MPKHRTARGGVACADTPLVTIGRAYASGVRGANLGISRRAGLIAGSVMLAIGVVLLVYGTAVA